jgi:hypothetical protein
MRSDATGAGKNAMECYTCKPISVEKRVSVKVQNPVPSDEIHALCKHFRTQFEQAAQ